MPDLSLHAASTGLDDDAASALRDILADPALPVASSLSNYPGVDGRRIAALREAHDYLTSRRIAAVALQSNDAAATLTANLRQIDPALAKSVGWHAVIVPVLSALPSSRVRNAVIGDVARGDLLTWAPTVRSWDWAAGAAPGVDHPIGKVDAVLEVDDYPGLYDAIALWQPGTGVVVVPTHRERVSWEPIGPHSADTRWLVRLARATVHADEVIPLESDPHEGKLS